MTPHEGQIKRMELMLLAKAFRVELVPQDPNDKPAALVLERIRNEKENDRKQK
jgi:type I restriction enzyme, S subunit